MSSAEERTHRPLAGLRDLHPRRFFWDTWLALDQEAEELRAARKARGETGYDWAPLVALCTGAVLLALMAYFGHAPTFHDLMDYFDPPGRIGPAEGMWATMRDSGYRRLCEFGWWSGWRVFGYFLIPALIIKVVLRERVTEYGLSTRGFTEHLWVYGLFYGVALVCVVAVSYASSFQEYYPFYRESTRSWVDFWSWELMYAAQFFALEFFFRGFWLHACKRAMGSHAIWAMVVPYGMIHFGKPFPETLAAIVAGVVLGTLALRTRSIWAGFMIHVSVAISMDVAALLQTTGLPEQLWPVLDR